MWRGEVSSNDSKTAWSSLFEIISVLILVPFLHLIDKGSLASLAEYFGRIEADVSHPDVTVRQLHRQGRRLIRRSFPTNRT